MVFLSLTKDTVHSFFPLPAAWPGFLWFDFSPTCGLISPTLQVNSEYRELSSTTLIPLRDKWGINTA